jgi:hypothetical protein
MAEFFPIGLHNKMRPCPFSKEDIFLRIPATIAMT